MDWDAPAIILDVRPFGEGDAIATVMTEAHGAHRGLARGGASRGRVALWQPGISPRCAGLGASLTSSAASLPNSSTPLQPWPWTTRCSLAC